MERTVIVITGPTCSGKTSLSIKVAEKLGSEIISVDSRQVYKYLDIGTAKPPPKILSRIKHHFIDWLYPDQFFDANIFEQEALKIINDNISRGKIPVAAGGSGLYFKALVDGMYDTAGKDESYREYLQAERDRYGNQHLYSILVKTDPECATRMIPQNWKRVMRALEVFHLTGKSILQHQKEYRRPDNPHFMMFGLEQEREILYKNINQRADDMIEQGLKEETAGLLEMGYSPSLNSLNTVGYKEIISYFNGEYDFDKAVELIKRNTRRYAKRQITWFRKDKRIKWFQVEDNNEMDRIAGIICNSVNLFLS